MAKAKRDPVREERIHDEIMVDAYGPEEQAMGWYYYLDVPRSPRRQFSLHDGQL
jgi:Calcium binding